MNQQPMIDLSGRHLTVIEWRYWLGCLMPFVWFVSVIFVVKVAILVF
ncbi:hypothetical protein [Aggregatilinea lenta]|nr:hypothetical protein [Aggregatilinea lenta]